MVFLGRGNENEEVFSSSHAAASELQQLVLLYPGQIDSASKEGLTYSPLLQSGTFSGSFHFSQIVQRNFLGASLNRNLPHRPDSMVYTLAAEIREGAKSTENNAEQKEDDTEGEESSGKATPLHVITITDLDFISEQFFEIRRVGPANLNFDNVTLFLNAIDTLVGDESFIALRNRRVRHRTLARVEDQTQAFIEQRTQEEGEAEQKAEQALAEAQGRLDERIAEVQNRADLDAQTKQIMARNLQEVENRRFEVLKTNIESEKEVEIRASEERMESQIRRIQSGIRTSAVLLPPIPVFLLGVYIFVRRQRNAREGAAAARRLREGA